MPAEERHQQGVQCMSVPGLCASQQPNSMPSSGGKIFLVGSEQNWAGEEYPRDSSDPKGVAVEVAVKYCPPPIPESSTQAT